MLKAIQFFFHFIQYGMLRLSFICITISVSVRPLYHTPLQLVAEMHHEGWLTAAIKPETVSQTFDVIVALHWDDYV